METQANALSKNQEHANGYTKHHDVTSAPHSSNSVQTQQTKPRHTLLARDGNTYTPLRIKQIAVFISCKKSVMAIDFSGSKHHIDESLTDVESLLDGPHFFRVNRNTILHVEAIRTFRIIEFGKIDVDLINPDWLEEDVHISQYRAPRFREWISGL